MNTDHELVDILLSYAEWQKFECKRALVQPNRLLETMVAFANTEGGYLVIGLEDPKKATGIQRLVGISEAPESVSEVLKQMSKEIDPPISNLRELPLKITNVKGAEDQLLVIAVPKSDEIHSHKRGDTFVRKGHQNVKLTAREITQLQYEKGALKFEGSPVDVFALDDLDRDLFATYQRDNNSDSSDVWQFLKDNGLEVSRSGRIQLTLAGALLFARNPTVLLGRKCGIKISHYYGIQRTYTGDPNFVRRPISIEGPLLLQIKQAIDYFRRVVRESPPRLRGSDSTLRYLFLSGLSTRR